MKNDFRFVWDDNAEEVFRALQDGKAEDYLFSVRIGDLCFDLKADEDDSAEYPIDYDLYVGGVDDGYGKSWRKPGYPYTWYGSDTFFESVLTMGFDEFKKVAEEEFVEYIKYDDSLIAKALEPLNIW